MKLPHVLIIALFAFSFQAHAQDNWKRTPPRFSPQEFTQRQEAFIIKESGLSTYEAANFFPLYRSMGKDLFELNRNIRKQMKRSRTPGLTEKEYAEILDTIDRLHVKKAELTRDYHQKFRKVLPTEKVLRVINADAKFDRQMLKEMMHHRFHPDLPHGGR